MIERQRNHELRNQERKLTSTGKRRKIEQKKIGDITGQKYIAVFKVEDLSDPQHRFKVDVNASQLHIRGRVNFDDNFIGCTLQSVEMQYDIC